MSKVTIVELRVSEEISSGQDVGETYIPPNGAEVWMEAFRGNAAFSANSAVMILWDFGGAGEEILWSTKGSELFSEQINVAVGDGVKKLCLCCSNGDDGDLVMSGYARFKVIT